MLERRTGGVFDSLLEEMREGEYRWRPLDAGGRGAEDTLEMERKCLR